MKNRLPPSLHHNGSNGRRTKSPLLLPAPRVGLGRRMLGQAARSVGDYPVASLTAAFFTGLVLAAWVKRS